MKRVIVLPSGARVSIGHYASTWRELKTMEPDQSVRGWNWFSVSVREVLADMRAGLHDRINQRGGVVLPCDTAARRARFGRRLDRARKLIPCECRWCGSLLPQWAPYHARFCDASCRRAYYL